MSPSAPTMRTPLPSRSAMNVFPELSMQTARAPSMPASGARSAVARTLLLARTGEGVNDASREIESTDALVLYVGDEQTATVVEVAVVRLAHLGLVAESTVTGVTHLHRCLRPLS